MPSCIPAIPREREENFGLSALSSSQAMMSKMYLNAPRPLAPRGRCCSAFLGSQPMILSALSNSSVAVGLSGMLSSNISESRSTAANSTPTSSTFSHALTKIALSPSWVLIQPNLGPVPVLLLNWRRSPLRLTSSTKVPVDSKSSIFKDISELELICTWTPPCELPPTTFQSWSFLPPSISSRMFGPSNDTLAGMAGASQVFDISLSCSCNCGCV
mmetsp:Transcript_27009/g.58867  ORF Transcript_27009/g.58867 Transcript_27009/m.58867 type:complete len:215 (-) Transcript_27009:172-816(-)